MANPFANRIVGYIVKKASELAANPLNWRKHPQRQRDAVQASLRELGWVAAVVENVRTGYLVDGHERVWQAMQNNEDVPVLQVDLSEEEERLALAIFDPIGALAEADAQALDALLREVNTGEAALQELISELAEDAGLYANGDGEPVDAEPQIDRAEELRQKWQVESGQLWQLGDHRLICGDCTDADVVARVMGGEKAALTVTSPPYPDAEMWETAADDLIELGNKTIQSVYDITFDGGVLCWNTADVPRSNDGMAPNIARDTLYAYSIGWRKRGDIVWEKGMSYLPLPSFTRRPTVPNCTHEAILVFFKGDWKPRDAKGQLNEDALAWNRESVWKMKTESAKALGHKAPFPLDLAIRCITLWSLDGDLVYEPFSGSGTTIIACEQLGRKCRAVEISPAYVAVALQRWADATGREPVLLEGADA